MELELKFSLPPADALVLEKQLARVPFIGRRRASRTLLDNTYFDTPEHALKAAGLALRVRRLGNEDAPRWVQTLKSGGPAASALSRRGEWENALSSATLDATLLRQTPWVEFDPDGSTFAALNPVFTTTFERLSWVVKHGDVRAEVALDRGEVLMDGHTTPLCELEIELLEGEPDDLFGLALLIAEHLALMPSHMSKAERAYRLADGTVTAPLRAKAPALHSDMDFAAVAQTVLRECFLQFTANLNSLVHSEAPEVLHQARVGWRRFKSALKLLGQLDEGRTIPAWVPLAPLLAAMTALRDLDVVTTEVMPLYAAAYQADDALRTKHWTQLTTALHNARSRQREAICDMLTDPALGRTLLHITRWLECGAPAVPHALATHDPQALKKWLKKRVTHVHEQLDGMPVRTKDPALQHAIRILCKRLRYSVESLQPLLPAKKAQRWARNAVRQQTRIGLERDRQQALQLAQQMKAHLGIVEFLRGAAFGATL